MSYIVDEGQDLNWKLSFFFEFTEFFYLLKTKHDNKYNSNKIES